MKTGVQRIYNYLEKLDSGFCRNDRKPDFQTSYEFINIKRIKKEKNSFFALMMTFFFPFLHGDLCALCGEHFFVAEK